MSLAVTGATTVASTSVTIPSHNIGDLIVIFALKVSNATAPTQPSAAGTVPAWNVIDTLSGSTAGSFVTAYFVATANNHTSGTWTGATGMTAVVISGGVAPSPIGGHATANGTSATIVTAPSVTMVNTDGTSVLIHFCGHNPTVSTWGSVPAGYTLRTTIAGAGTACITKDDTTSDGSVAQPVTSSVSTGFAAATVEVLAPTAQGKFFSLF